MGRPSTSTVMVVSPVSVSIQTLMEVMETGRNPASSSGWAPWLQSVAGSSCTTGSSKMVANASLAGGENPKCSQLMVRAVTVPIRPMAIGSKTTFLAKTMRSLEVKFVFFIRLQFALVAFSTLWFPDEQRVLCCGLPQKESR